MSKVSKRMHARVITSLFKYLHLCVPRTWITGVEYLENLVTVPARGLLHPTKFSISMGSDEDPQLQVSPRYTKDHSANRSLSWISKLIDEEVDSENTGESACFLPVRCSILILDGYRQLYRF